MRCRPELIVFAAALLAGGPAHAAPGDLDLTFGDGGLVALHRGPGNHTATDVLAQPDGRIVATGLIDSTFALARLEPDGQLDASFAAGGILLVPDLGGDTLATGIVRQPDGKLVAGGNTLNFPQLDPHFALLARCDAHGVLDPSFGIDGLVRLPMSNVYYMSQIALQPDGRIIGVGALNTGVGAQRDGFVVRLAADGSLDAAFGAGGLVTIDTGDFEDLNAVALQADGRIVVTGGGGPLLGADLIVARLDPSGALDSTFGAGGIVRTDLGSGFDQAISVSLQADGRILVGGGGEAKVLRYESTGTLDPTFGTEGMVTITDCRFPKVVQQADGKLVVLGSTFVPRNGVILARLEASGAPDPTLGRDGVSFVQEGLHGPTATALDLQADGRYLAAAQTGIPDVGSAFSVLRFCNAGPCAPSTTTTTSSSTTTTQPPPACANTRHPPLRCLPETLAAYQIDCAGDLVTPALGRQLARLRALVVRLDGARTARRARRRDAKVAATVRTASRVIRRAGHQGALVPACASAVRALLDRVRAASGAVVAAERTSLPRTSPKPLTP